ncbi:MAG: DNA mismatch repair protein MutS [Bacteroidales bacterium]|nr:DNA mismatch repair protein MutS [Bacteroidales bacterium]
MKAAEDTPLLKQFFAVKAQFPDTVLLYRVGDFYETYGDDALLATKVLGIVLTKRSNGDKEAVPMAGFPHHALDVYLPKLVRAGYKAAICDQLEDPALAGKKLVKRGVTEVVTPGIAFSDDMLIQKENNFLAGLTFEKDCCGVAFLDVSTGSFQIAQGSLDYIGTLLSSFNPKEIVVQHGYEKGVKERFGNYYVSTLDEWAFVYEASVENIKKQLCVDSLKGYAIDNFPLGICSAGALLVYLKQTQHTGLKNITSLSRIDEGKFVWMDKFTFRNLEVFHALSGGEEGVALVDVVDRCSSPMGARLLRQWLAMPVMDIRELNDRYDIVQHFVENDGDLAELQKSINAVGDLERIISRAANGKIAPREVMQLGRSLAQMEPIKEICGGKGIAPLDSLCAKMKNCGELLGEIRRVMSADPAAAIGKGDIIAEGVSPELDELRSISRGSKEYLLQMQQREIERTGITSLKISYNNVFGYYIEVRNTARDKVPEEWVRKQTLVNAERYITSELKEYEEKILGAEEKIYALESRLYADLVGNIQQKIVDIQTNCRIISRIDVLSGFAQLAVCNHYCRPEVNESLELEIIEGRHPVIETLMPAGEEYVPNDIFLDNKKQQIIILTGPNMAGKSALLRQTALIVLLAQTGCFVPAKSARIGYFDKIFTRVGATDNISRGESTFMVEMLETSMIMHNLSDRSLVLLDEIGRGTSTYDGMSIARALVEFLHENGKRSKTLFATHYHELNDLEDKYERVKNFHIAVKESGKQIIFLRKLKEGGVAHSFGIHVARLAGMPPAVIEAAERTLKQLEAGTGGQPVKTSIKEEEGLQLSFFQLDDPTLSALRDQLKAADLNNMTPLEAFDLLRSMKKEIGL